MHASISGALENLDISWKAFEHKGEPMTKHQVRLILIYGLKQGYTSTSQLTDDEVDKILKEN